MKSYRIYRDISAENEDEVVAWMDECAGEAITEDGTLGDMFQIKENPFTGTEEEIIQEIARVALSDADIYEHVADKLDLADDVLKQLQEKLNK